MRSINDANIKSGMKVLVRCDLDVPIGPNGPEETFRLEASTETINHILHLGGLPIIIGHIGQPDGVYDKAKSTDNLRTFFNNKFGENKYLLLENLRFDKREEENDDQYAQELAKLADIYVNECFSTAHRKHASVNAIMKFIPSFAGFRLQKEVQTLNNILENPKRPFSVIIGGAKLESKLPVVTKMLDIADHVLLAGKLGPQWTGDKPAKLHIPVDYAEDQKDLGTKTLEEYTKVLKESKSVLWAGPAGMYEDERFIEATRIIARTIIENHLYSTIGGGDTIAALSKLRLLEKFSFVSVGGGAMLTYISEGTLPAIKALEENEKNFKSV
jgi:phosphoglycerate kinase